MTHSPPAQITQAARCQTQRAPPRAYDRTTLMSNPAASTDVRDATHTADTAADHSGARH